MFGIEFPELVGIFMVSLMFAIPVILVAFTIRWAVSGGVRDAARKKGNDARWKIGAPDPG